MTAWGTPHQWLRPEPDLAPLLVLALCSMMPFLLLRVRLSLFSAILSLLIGFSWLAASTVIGAVIPSLILIVLLAGMARRKAP
ncbi:MAG: hypothetical protein ACRDH8_10840 [Actinomycetota bacterium]